MGLNF